MDFSIYSCYYISTIELLNAALCIVLCVSKFLIMLYLIYTYFYAIVKRSGLSMGAIKITFIIIIIILKCHSYEIATDRKLKRNY